MSPGCTGEADGSASNGSWQRALASVIASQRLSLAKGNTVYKYRISATAMSPEHYPPELRHRLTAQHKWSYGLRYLPDSEVVSPPPTASAPRAADVHALREQLADIEHQRWAAWQEWVHNLCTGLDDGSLVIPAELVARWKRQIDTPYGQLSEREKSSDRREVDRYLPLVLATLAPAAGA